MGLLTDLDRVQVHVGGIYGGIFLLIVFNRYLYHIVKYYLWLSPPPPILFNIQ